MNLIEQILTKYNFQKRIHALEPIEFQTKNLFKHNLPKDYLDFVMNFDGFEDFIGNEYVRLWSSEELLDLNEAYGILEEFSDLIGIGGNGGDEFIGIEFLDNGLNRIVLSPLIGMEKEQHIEIGSSFNDFLIRLDSGQKWFD